MRAMGRAIGRGVGRGVVLGAWLGATGGACGEPEAPPADGSTTDGTEATTSSTGPSSASTTALPDPTSTSSSTAVADDTASSGSSGTTDGNDGSSGSGSTTGEPACAKNVVLMGYWPPTNEMLRPWSTNPEQNPGGWVGADWEGHGFDVYAFFPEFPPDGDPSNDPIGSPGSVGSEAFDLQVDYQATSEDFWRIVDELQPVILITTSRGGGIGWEIEAIEGGHGMGNPGDPAFDWSSDQYGAVTRPTMESIDPLSWDAISTYRQGSTLPSQLPMDVIFDATLALGVTSVEIDQDGTSGNYLSGFLGLHGLYFNQVAPYNVAAGHIHVGTGLPVEDASVLIEETLRVVLQEHPAETVGCSPGA